MKFEYKLDYDFVTKELKFQITKMPEDLRKFDCTITTIVVNDTEYRFMSYSYPAIYEYSNTIYLRGNNHKKDDCVDSRFVEAGAAAEVAIALEKFQEWVENRDEEVVMSIAEIEEKLGIKNLKIRKETN